MRVTVPTIGSCGLDPRNRFAASCTSPPPATPSGFHLVADYTIDRKAISPVVVGSTTYSLGETIHFDLIFDSFADATQDRSTSMTINKANEVSVSTSSAPTAPTAASLYLETDTYFVIWNDSDPTPPVSRAWGPASKVPT